MRNSKVLDRRGTLCTWHGHSHLRQAGKSTCVMNCIRERRRKRDDMHVSNFLLRRDRRIKICRNARTIFLIFFITQMSDNILALLHCMYIVCVLIHYKSHCAYTFIYTVAFAELRYPIDGFSISPQMSSRVAE